MRCKFKALVLPKEISFNTNNFKQKGQAKYQSELCVGIHFGLGARTLLFVRFQVDFVPSFRKVPLSCIFRCAW